jgi:hypothetical protein
MVASVTGSTILSAKGSGEQSVGPHPGRQPLPFSKWPTISCGHGHLLLQMTSRFGLRVR